MTNKEPKTARSNETGETRIAASVTCGTVRSGAWLGGFVVREETYPNGERYLSVSRGKKVIGHCKELDAGYLVWGKRKPVATLLLAAKQMLDDRMNECHKEATKCRDMLGMLKKECGPIPPNDPKLSDRGARRDGREGETKI